MDEKELKNIKSEDNIGQSLDRMLDACCFQPVDNSRIKSLVHEKIRLEQKARKRKIRRIAAWSLSAAAAVALIAGIGFSYLSPSSFTDLSAVDAVKLAKAGYKEMTVPMGERMELRLADGTRMIANSGSKVIYPEAFHEKERRVYARGEVYFEVAKDAYHPFVVESENFDVRVLGTVFNISTPTDSTASVVLVEGSVQIDMENDRTIRLKPNDKADLLNGEVQSLTEVDSYDYTSWIRGLLYLKGMPLEELIQNLNGYYGVNISCHHSLGATKVYGKLDLNSNLDTVLKSISEIVPMKIKRSGNDIMLEP